jgi:hypothetical protein
MSAIQQMLMSSNGGGDPYFAMVGLLLHMDGANGGTTFTDNSSSPKTVTPTACTTSTTQAKFGTASARYASGATTAKLTIAHDASISPTGDFTVECWVWVPAVAGAIRQLLSKTIGAGFAPYSVRLTTSGVVQVYAADTGGTTLPINLTGGTTVTANAWNHVAFTRQGSTYRSYLNGAFDRTGTYAGAGYFNAAHPLVIGNTTADDYPLGSGGDAYIDDVRITVGAARYTTVGSFTLPTQPFPDF